MTLQRIYEQEELSPAQRRILDETRAALDLPFIPTLFKVLAGKFEYLRVVWDDLAQVLHSKEFSGATLALAEQVRILAIDGGWRLPDQAQMLAEQNLTGPELALFGGITGTFARAFPQELLVARLLQRGYHGGQRGRVTEAFASSAFSELLEFHIPPEKTGGLRVWLIYTDIRRSTGAAYVPSVYRMLSPFPGYLASVWLEIKRISQLPEVRKAMAVIDSRSNALITGLPVRDHRKFTKRLTHQDWLEIEDTVENYVRTMPQFALTTTVWNRSFPVSTPLAIAA
jgi:hypothetical protein